MFLYHSSWPIDQRSALEPGLYEGNAALYLNTASPHRVLMAEYRRAERNAVSAVEIFHYKNDGTFTYCNFVRLASGVWRNNQGELNKELADFLPEELFDLRVSKNMPLSPQLVGARNTNASSYYVH